jgi:hypothetical protein
VTTAYLTEPVSQLSNLLVERRAAYPSLSSRPLSPQRQKTPHIARPRPMLVAIQDLETGDRTLMPVTDLAQDSFDVVCH